MDSRSPREYYLFLLSALRGLQDDLDANEAPEEAKELLRELTATCEEDFIFRFGDLPGGSG